MSHYQTLAQRTVSADAMALARRLGAWHDRMVAHQRALAAGIGRRCDEACPHAEAVELWRLAVESFGDAAERLVFLKTTAVAVQRWPVARDGRADAVRATVTGR